MKSGEPLKTMASRLPPSSGRLHLGDHVLEEEQAPVVDPGQPGPEAPAEAELLALVPDHLLDLLPLDPEGRIGEQVVERLALVAVLAEGVAADDVARRPGP